MDKKAKEIIRKHALLNAFKYGKADSSRIISKVIGEMPALKDNINGLKAAINEIVFSVNKMKKEEIEKEIKKLGVEEQEEKKEKKGLPELHNTENGVVMRFAPSPSGPLHIGHAYVLGLNSEYCRRYKGKLILRIEDTNPTNIDPYSYNQIAEDAQWLTKGNISEIVIQSDRIENYYDYALQMINKGVAYVCTCSSDDFKQYSLKKEECPCRSNDINKNLDLWKRMFSDFNEGDAVLRFKTDMKHKNPAMRDFPLMRICDEEHPRKGKKYRVWPLMNFAVACDDYDLGITHVLRGKDHADNAKRQEFIQHAMNWPVPETLFVGRINFEGLNLSCSETKQMIKEGLYSGWDDIRLPFLVALRRRGYQPDAFIKYALSVGVTLVDKHVNKDEFFKMLNAFNKEIIDPKSDRYFFIHKPVKIKIENAPKQEIELDLYPDRRKGGRFFSTADEFYITEEDFKSLKDNELYRLMDCLNFVKKGNKFIFDSLDYEKFKEKGKKIMHWLPVSDNLAQVKVLMPDNTFIDGIGEEGLRNVDFGEIVQFERFGFCRLDHEKGNKLIFWFAHK